MTGTVFTRISIHGAVDPDYDEFNDFRSETHVLPALTLLLIVCCIKGSHFIKRGRYYDVHYAGSTYVMIVSSAKIQQKPNCLCGWIASDVLMGTKVS